MKSLNDCELAQPNPPDSHLVSVPYPTSVPRSSYLKVSDVMTGDNETYDWTKFEGYLSAAASRSRHFVARYYVRSNLSD